MRTPQTLCDWCGFLIKGEVKRAYFEKNIHAKLSRDLEAVQKRLLETENDPYKYSDLSNYFSLETWYWRDALLLLAGAEPTGAKVDWDGYNNFLNVHIDSPNVVDLGFLDGRLPDYSVPNEYECGKDKNYFKGDEAVETKVCELRNLKYRLDFLYKHWKSALSTH